MSCTGTSPLSVSELSLMVLRVLDSARPDSVLAVLRPLLTEHLDARRVRLLLTNYQLTALRPIQDPDDQIVLPDTPAGEAFLTQQPVRRDGRADDPDSTDVYLPISIRGDRIGVLELSLPKQFADKPLDELGELASVIGYALQGASTQSDTMARAARTQRLTLAAELQWQLLPGRGCRGPEYQLAGHLEPAYDVHADNFDWSQDEDQLVISITDAAWRGQGPPLMTTLAVAALRNARRSGLDIAGQAQMADQTFYAYHQGRQYLSTLLIRIELNTGRAQAVLAGSPRLFRLREDQVHLVPLTDQLPLGMFEGTDYVAEEFSLGSGDRLLLVSDGLHAAQSPTQETFGDRAVPEVLRETADLPVGGVVRRVIDELFEHRELAELDDDAVVVCLDWTGPSSISTRDTVNGHPSKRQPEPQPSGSANPHLRLIPGGRDGQTGPRGILNRAGESGDSGTSTWSWSRP